MSFLLFRSFRSFFHRLIVYDTEHGAV